MILIVVCCYSVIMYGFVFEVCGLVDYLVDRYLIVFLVWLIV